MGIRELEEVYMNACEDCPVTMEPGAVMRMADALLLIRSSHVWADMFPAERRSVLEALDMYYGRNNDT